MSFLSQFHLNLTGNEQGPKLVFLHGLMGSAANWRRNIRDFEAEYHVLAYDQRGHGRTKLSSEGFRPEDYAQDLKKILDELQWERIFLVGHSMGGRNALQFAFEHPGRVEKLVVEDIGPDKNEGALRRIQGILERVKTPFLDKKSAKAFIDKEFSANGVLGAFLYSNLEEKSGTVDWRFSKSAILETLIAGRTQDRWELVDQLKVKTLVLRGETSEDLSREVFERMTKNPLIQGIEIKGAGHWIHFEKPSEFVDVVKEFFAGS